MDPIEKPSIVLKAAISPAVTKNTAILSGDLRANRPMRLRYTSCRSLGSIIDMMQRGLIRQTAETLLTEMCAQGNANAGNPCSTTLEMQREGLCRICSL